MALDKRQIPRLKDVRALEGYRLWLRYEDGAEGVVDISHLAGRGVFQIWNQPGLFEAVGITDHGAVAWAEEIELCPDALYLRLMNKQPAELLPGLSPVQTDA